jgi:hypothetical protein
MKRWILAVAAASALAFSMGPAATRVAASVPTEIEASPNPLWLNAQCAWHQYSDRAYWTVSLYGGTSGQYRVTVYYGDGSPGNTSYHSGSYDTHHDYLCNNGWLNQTWSAWRSGGGTGYDYTQVDTY